jgi:hypothetical protein
MQQLGTAEILGETGHIFQPCPYLLGVEIDGHPANTDDVEPLNCCIVVDPSHFWFFNFD